MPADHPTAAPTDEVESDTETRAESEEDPIVSIGADVDVRAIVAEVKAEVARKAALDMYPPDLMAELVASSDKLMGAVEAVRNTAHVEFRPPVRSHRPVLGTALTLTKWSIRRLLRFQSMHMAGEVNTFAGNTANAFALTAERLQDLEERQSASMARLERVEARLRRVARLSTQAAPASTGSGAPNAAVRSSQAETLIDYAAFEDQFRGSSDELGKRQAGYVELFVGQSLRVLDVGCGRGEFLGQLRRAGISAYGIDLSPAMVQRAREAGVDARVEDAFEHLESVRPESLGGVFSAQVVEHFDPAQLALFFELAARALAPGGVFVAETLNPQSLSTFTGPLYVDLGHARPLHPLTLQFIAQSVGLREVELRFLSPIPAEHRLSAVPTGDGEQGALVERINENFRRIDEAMFGPLDFAVIAKK